MGLISSARLDVQGILSDLAGPGQLVTLTPPGGEPVSISAFIADISEQVDQETGTIIPLRSTSITLSMYALREAGLVLPVGVISGSAWRVSLPVDAMGNAGSDFRIAKTFPDHTVGITRCHLERV